MVGGGPAGLEAARVAALRGHEVTLYEKEPKLGGLMPLIGLVKGVDIEGISHLISDNLVNSFSSSKLPLLRGLKVGIYPPPLYS